MTQNVHLLIIDPQNDFCDKLGALYVPGSENDISRLSTLINENTDSIDQIHVTLDTHSTVDISHQIWWVNENGEQPDPFTIISEDDVKTGVWKATIPAFRERSIKYVTALAETGKNPLCIWPYHCLEGSWGHSIPERLFDSLFAWEQKFTKVNFIHKGQNMWTEHYSAIKADVPDPLDESTKVNKTLIDNLKNNADLILVGGEASSHCVANTVLDLIEQFDDHKLNNKIVYLYDCCSCVPNFEQLEKDFIEKIKDFGVTISDSKSVKDLING